MQIFAALPAVYRQEIRDRMSLDHRSHEVTPKQCATELMETMPSVMQFVRAEMRSQSASLLSVPQFRVLAFLRIYPGSSLSEVAEHLGVTRATASAMTDRLVQRGLVNRSERPQERRHIALTLTEAGSAHLQQSREKTRDEIAALLKCLTEDQLISLSAGLAVLHQVFTSATVQPAD